MAILLKTLKDAGFYANWIDEPFKAIVSNSPYSIKWDGDAKPLMINDPRFSPELAIAIFPEFEAWYRNETHD